jgi:hypothetical protein
MGHNMKILTLAVAASIATVAAAPAAAQETRAVRSVPAVGLSFTTGADYSIGDYGAAENTNILVVPLNVRATTGGLRLSATLPYLRIDGPGNIVGGGEGGPILVDPRAPSPRQVREGLGDLTLGATYSLPSEALTGFDVDIGGRVKLPTASQADRLGTGKADFSVMTDISRPIGNMAPFVTLGYRMPGSPEGVDLRNSVFGSVGTSVVAGPAVFIASYDYAGATNPLSQDSHNLFGAVSGPVANRLNLTGYGTVGLSKGAPDFGVGLLLTVRAF